LLSHLGGKGVKVPDGATTIKPDIYTDVDTIRFLLVRRDCPPDLVVMVRKASSLLVMEDAQSTGILVEIVDDE
jgi:hypothetical protein